MHVSEKLDCMQDPMIFFTKQTLHKGFKIPVAAFRCFLHPCLPALSVLLLSPCTFSILFLFMVTSGYFCTLCESTSLPSICTMVFGSHVEISEHRREIRVILYIWDRRLTIKDYLEVSYSSMAVLVIVMNEQTDWF